jgi:hypothetical protein
MKFILMKILINLHKIEVCAQPIQNLWLRPLKSGYFDVALNLKRIFIATKSFLKIDFIFSIMINCTHWDQTIFQSIVEGLIMIYTNASQTRFGGSQVIRNHKLFNLKVNESHVITLKNVIRGQKKVYDALIYT